MKAYTRRVVFCCILLGSYTLTDAYGLSQKTSGNKKPEKQTQRGKQAKQSKTPTTAGRAVKPDTKLATEILELQRMYHQLNQEKVSKAGLDRKQQLLSHIENQIKLRQRKQTEQQLSMQEQQQQQPQQQQQQQQQQLQPQQQQHRYDHQQVAHVPQVAQARKVHQFFNPVQSLSPHSDRHVNQHVLTHQHVDQYQGLQTQGHNLVLNSNWLPVQSVQTEAQAPQTQVQVVQKQPIQFIDTQPVHRPVVQHVGPQQHILVPLTALSSGQILNGQGMMSDKIILVNSLVKSQAVEEALPQNKPPATTTTTTTTTMATTKQPTTTVTPAPTEPPTTPSTEETVATTALDFESMKQTLLERGLKKQSLEIKKLQLEIRALQRQERNSLPEENEDGPQPRRFAPRQMPMPFIR